MLGGSLDGIGKLVLILWEQLRKRAEGSCLFFLFYVCCGGGGGVCWTGDGVICTRVTGRCSRESKYLVLDGDIFCSYFVGVV